MQLTNNWKEKVKHHEIIDEYGNDVVKITTLFLKGDITESQRDSLYAGACLSLNNRIQSLLDTRTREILEVFEGKVKNFVFDNGECSICGFDEELNEGVEHSCVEINMTLLKILSEIKSNYLK